MKRNRILKVGFLILAMTCFVLMSLGAGAVEIRPVAGGEGGEALKVQFSATRTSYKKGEPIEFTVQGNRPFYLYLFSVDEKHREGIILLPNSIQENNLLEGGKTHVIPEGKYQFVADRSGVERILMVASTEKLPLSTQGCEAKDAFWAADSQVIEEKAKALTVRVKSKPVFQELALVITD